MTALADEGGVGAVRGGRKINWPLSHPETGGGREESIRLWELNAFCGGEALLVWEGW